MTEIQTRTRQKAAKFDVDQSERPEPGSIAVVAIWRQAGGCFSQQYLRNTARLVINGVYCGFVSCYSNLDRTCGSSVDEESDRQLVGTLDTEAGVAAVTRMEC